LDVFDVFAVCPVNDEAGDRTEVLAEGDWILRIFFARIVSIFLVKMVSGISGSSRTQTVLTVGMHEAGVLALTMFQ
jgi:hypothetical protein